MELTTFNTMPEELIRHIIGYARPTYPYLVEFKLANEVVENPNYSPPLTYYLNTITHNKTFMNYRIYGDYVRYYGGEWGGDYLDVMREIKDNYEDDEDE
jgi:hypothetical protein